jgi:ESCRT-II complex subunit VPS25
MWGDLILDYCRFHKIFRLDLNEARSTSPLFNNKTINRKLSAEALKEVMKMLLEQGNAQWMSKDEKVALIVWRTHAQWGDLIYKYITEKSMFNVVCSIYELREQDTVQDQEFYMLDLHVFHGALARLQNRKLCQVFEGTTEDSTSVKFFSSSDI